RTSCCDTTMIFLMTPPPPSSTLFPYTTLFRSKLAGLALLALALLAAWIFREPILRTASRWIGPHGTALPPVTDTAVGAPTPAARSEEHTSELQSLRHLVCRLLLEKKKRQEFIL